MSYNYKCFLLVTMLSGCQTYVASVTPQDVRPVPGIYEKKISEEVSSDVLREKADAGDAHAQSELGARYGEKNPEEAFRYYTLAAQQGLAIAQCNLAYMYLQGEATAKDEQKAIDWYSKCAKQGHFAGEYALGRMYVVGQSLPKNGVLAEQWFLLAANQGFLPAQEALLYMYENGVGVPKNSQKAMLWLHRVRDAKITGFVWKQDS